MPIIRTNKNSNYSVISNQYLKNKLLSLEAKGLMSIMLSLPDDWSFSTRGLCILSNQKIGKVNKCLN